MLSPVKTVFTTYPLRHSRLHAQAPRRVLCVNVRRICLERRVVIGSQGSGFDKQPSIFFAQCRAAPVASAIETLQPYLALATAAVLSHAAATTQTVSLRLAHPFGCRRAKVALRCTTASRPHAPSQLVAQAPFQRALPNYRSSGQAGSNVPQSTIVAACRSPKRWTRQERRVLAESIGVGNR